ncbi:ferredoxin [Actinoplanes sp. OR16]|uniref:PDR/VanB family oxidoreductase n=1 Tax=Actinoplanes sp. OR16 TaxID=946334 RepID=UPI000F6F5AE4|nr:PDR/VanB family oxidoreductase [Actinoplanes sp. OR16]BBH70200.1 ferredoxin [Actinoplanes sp. OR16]
MHLRVDRRDEIAAGVVALDLRHPDGRDLAGWTPGAHVDLTLKSGLVRQFSLCGDPGDRTLWRIAVRRADEGRGGSRHVHDHLAENDHVEVSAPRNHFPLRPAARYLFIAGGIGITPILPMVVETAGSGAGWQLHYAGRDTASMPFREQLSAYGENVRLYPEDTHGLMDLDSLLGSAAPDVLVYCCGPDSLLRAVQERRPDVYAERFAPVESDRLVPDQEFDVELEISRRTLRVPAGRSILDVLEEAGVDVLSSCREGTCGTCETTVLAGVVDHRDSLLTEEERAANDTMFVCVSRAAGGRLVLDL